MTATAIPFRKMNGLGNDFVIVDARTGSLGLNPDAIARIASRETGIGCDQFIALQPSQGADVFMRIFNPDGGQAGACGNATRCVADILARESGKKDPVIETVAGLLPSNVNDDGSVSVDMGAPKFDWQDIPLSEEFRDTRGIELHVGPVGAPVLDTPAVANVGNPHAVFFVGDVDTHDLERIGPVLENHPLFPDRANISLAHVIDERTIRVRVWERGAGITLACGSGACAVAVCAARKKLTGRDVDIHLPGGMLNIRWRDDDHMIMTGPLTYDYEGTIPPELVTGAAS